ncbi:Spo11/DNA topoisomerase VI subunit A [Crucibulum laeve]|uniref:DNA topoisomerase (ATP-hydrolyzing) n=1 Tax=Crucibulum laeve TaxID=68775 RepID=A0A5C3MHR7_9AGAR|nr:Spo11/DNA topoisomerase VI subunit A [Crucibulum laeve]
MVLDFLNQLVFSGRTKASDNSDEESEPDPDRPGSKPTRVKPKIEIRLADRSKGIMDGHLSILSSNFVLYSYTHRCPAMKTIKYPRKCAKGSARPLAQLFRVLDLTHAALVENTRSTKRDVYYHDVALFKTQKVVDSLIDDLAATFKLERSDLNIRATSKGLICGSGLTIQLLSGELVQANDTEGTLIPVGEDIQSFGVDKDISWVLIVEKDAVFQTLCRLNIVDHPSMPGRGLIITGKGYPDIATRHLVKSLAEALPQRQVAAILNISTAIPIMAFVDADPYGLDILSIYKYGSRAMQHESSKLTAKRVKWLGLWASEVESFGIDRNSLTPVTKHDEKKALSMLCRSSITLPSKWKKELMHMLHSRRKAEIEILSAMKATPLTDDTHRLLSRKYLDRIHSNSPKTVHDGFSSPHSLYLSSQASTSSSNSSTALCSSLPTTPSSSPPPGFTTDRVAPPAPLLRYLSTKINDFVSSAQARANAVPY